MQGKLGCSKKLLPKQKKSSFVNFVTLIDSAHLFTGDQEIIVNIREYAVKTFNLKKSYKTNGWNANKEDNPEHINIQISEGVYLVVPISFVKSAYIKGSYAENELKPI